MHNDLPELDVSVVIVSWNARSFLRQCLASLYSDAGRKAREIIVVDNASTDGAPEAVEAEFPGVRLIRNAENLGFAKANNIGVRQSAGRYICFLNSDAEVIGDCLGQLVDYCESHPEVGMAGPHVTGKDGKLQRSCRGFPTVWNMFCRTLALDTCFPRIKIFSGYSMGYWPHDELREVDILSGCFWLARRKAMDEVGLLSEEFFMYGEDMDWCKRYDAKGWKLVFVPQAKSIHYGGGSSANAPVRFAVEMQRADLQYWRKHHSSLAVGCFIALSFLHAVLRTAGYGIAYCCRRAGRAVYGHKIARSIACFEDLLGHRFPSERPGGLRAEAAK